MMEMAVWSGAEADGVLLGRQGILPRRRISFTGVAWLVALLIGASFAHPSLAAAQVDVHQAEATRAQLESLYARLTPKQKVYAEAVALKERLDEGDFQVGDRINLTVRGDTALSGAFVVDQARAINLPNIGEIPLTGVLRSELQAHLDTVLSRYIRSPEITTESLMRVAVVGQVGRPGFYYLPAVSLTADAITAAGGLTGTSDLKKSTVARNGQVLISSEQFAQQMSTGRTLDQMNLQSGDEIRVGEKHKGSAVNIIILAGAIATALLAIIALTNVVKH